MNPDEQPSTPMPPSTLWERIPQYWKTIVAIAIVIVVAIVGLYIALGKAVPQALYTGPIQYEMVKVHNGKYEVPQVVGFPDKVVEEKVNVQLREIGERWGCYSMSDPIDALRDIAKWLKNHSTDPDSELDAMNAAQLLAFIQSRTTFDVAETVRYARDGIFSVDIRYEADCGGAYPLYGEASITFDMATGEQVPFEKLFANYERDKQAIEGPLLAQMADLFLVEDKQCRDEYERGATLNYYIAPDGVRVFSYFGTRATHGCAEEITVRPQSLSQFFDSKSILSRIAYVDSSSTPDSKDISPPLQMGSIPLGWEEREKKYYVGTIGGKKIHLVIEKYNTDDKYAAYQGEYVYDGSDASIGFDVLIHWDGGHMGATGHRGHTLVGQFDSQWSDERGKTYDCDGDGEFRPDFILCGGYKAADGSVAYFEFHPTTPFDVSDFLKPASGSINPAFEGMWEYTLKGPVTYPPDDPPSTGIQQSFTLNLDVQDGAIILAWDTLYNNGMRLRGCSMDTKTSTTPDPRCGSGHAVDQKTVILSFSDGYGGGEGKARIVYNPADDTLTWEITKESEEEFYLPLKATLERAKTSQ